MEDGIQSVKENIEDTRRDTKKQGRQNFNMRRIPIIQKAGIDSAAVDVEGWLVC